MKLQLDQRFKKNLKGVIEDYEFQVGIIKDGAHKWPLSYKLHGLKSFLNGPARKISRKESYANMSDISKRFRQKEDYLRAPFKNHENKDVLELLRRFFDVIKDRSKGTRLRNTLQAVVRNPILRQDYGSNTEATAKRKGFNRYIIDTGQFFNAIIARVTKRGKEI